MKFIIKQRVKRGLFTMSKIYQKLQNLLETTTAFFIIIFSILCGILPTTSKKETIEGPTNYESKNSIFADGEHEPTCSEKCAAKLKT